MLEKAGFFSPDCCQLCGECLFRCPVLGYSRSQAKQEKERLNQGLPSPVLARCTTCFSCNFYCPNQCRPYELILLRWDERYHAQGLPAIARMVIPGDRASIWSQLYPLLPTEEKAIVRSWREIEDKPGKEILLTGCFNALSPYLTMTPLLADLTPYGDERLWCSGGHIYQLGLLEVVDRIGQRAKRVFDKLQLKRVVTMMAAEYAMLTKILPEKFGITFDCDVIPLERWLWERIEQGKLQLNHKIGKRITIHDNCFSKSIGDQHWQIVRDIANACGAEIVEMEHNRQNALCCGFGAAAGRFSLLDLVGQGARRLREAEASGADWLVVSCSACYFVLSVVKELFGSRLELFHLLELVDTAEGRRPIHRTRERAYDIISVISANLTRMAFISQARRQFWVDLSEFDREIEPSEIPFQADRLTGFFNRLYRSRVVQNGATQASIHGLVRLILHLRRRFPND